MRERLRKVNFPAGSDETERTFERDDIETHEVCEMTIWEPYAGQISHPNAQQESDNQYAVLKVLNRIKTPYLSRSKERYGVFSL